MLEALAFSFLVTIGAAVIVIMALGWLLQPRGRRRR